jgi:putative intracellular protease/amidase
MTGAIDMLDPERPKRVVTVISNPSVSELTGCPIGFWCSELTHPHWQLTEHGYQVDVASPDGGSLEADSWSDPRDESRFSADEHGDERVHAQLASFYEAGKVAAMICQATCMLLRTRLSDGGPLVDGKTWTGFASSEERFADEFVGQGRFKSHAVRDGNLITGQQQDSGTAPARLMIEALGT